MSSLPERGKSRLYLIFVFPHCTVLIKNKTCLNFEKNILMLKTKLFDTKVTETDFSEDLFPDVLMIVKQ